MGNDQRRRVQTPPSAARFALRGKDGIVQAAYLFIAAGVIGLINDVLFGVVSSGNLGAVLLDGVNLCAGLVVWSLRGKRILLGPLSLLLPILAMAIIASNNISGDLPEATFGTWFVLVMVWVGVWYRQWTSLTLAPVVACAYLVPLFAGAPHSPDAVSAVFIVIPVAVLAGETIARFCERARRSEIEWRRLLGELSHRSTTDELTGVGNRSLGTMVLNALEPGDAVVLIDVDHFKEINDRLGHPAGDGFLKQLGRYLNDAVREGDAVARMGGDEFMIVMHHADATSVEAVARLITGWRVPTPLTTLSAGVAIHPPHTTAAQTYAAADASLYLAKQLGRDRVVGDAEFARKGRPKRSERELDDVAASGAAIR